MRSHALTSSSLITHLYDEIGILYDLNHLVHPEEGMKLKAYEGQNGKFTVIPFIYEDDVWISKGKKESHDYFIGDAFSGPRVFNFHPIHIFLNTDSIETYERAKCFSNDFEKLKCMVNKAHFGVRDFFEALINECCERGYEFKKINDGVWK